MGLWICRSSARIRTAPHPPHTYSTVGLPLSSSTGGAVTAAAITNGVGTTLRVFRENVGNISTQFTDGTPTWRKTSIYHPAYDPSQQSFQFDPADHGVISATSQEYRRRRWSAPLAVGISPIWGSDFARIRIHLGLLPQRWAQPSIGCSIGF
jgi:hypothetical protein